MCIRDSGDPIRVEAGLLRLVGEAVARERGDDDVEGVRRIAAMARRVRERADHLVHLVEAARPAVGEDQGQRCFASALDVDEVNPVSVDLSAEVREAVELTFLRTPVELVSPVARELLEVRDVCAVVPPRCLLYTSPSPRDAMLSRMPSSA